MGLKVAKFGGSSVADAIQLMKIKEIIEADDEMRYVVVSAPGKRFSGDTKITDLLYLCKTHMDHNVPYDQLLQVIEDRYVAAAVSLLGGIFMKGSGVVYEPGTSFIVEVKNDTDLQCTPENLAKTMDPTVPRGQVIYVPVK